MRPGTVSSQRVIGIEPEMHAQMVADDLIAWHAQEDNPWWLSIEFTQPLPGAHYTDWQIEIGQWVVAGWFKKYGLEASRQTIRRHEDTAQGIRCGKSDPGGMFPYQDFIDGVCRLMEG